MHPTVLPRINNVALYGSRRQDGFTEAIWKLISSLRAADITVQVEKKLADALSEAGYRLAVHSIKSVSQFPADTQLAISIGGDGTFLRTARWLAGREVPVLGINTGHLGFLAENAADNAEAIVEMLRSGNATVERRLMLQVECETLSPSDWPVALNEVAFLKGAASMIDVTVEVDNFFVASYKADGLLVATPTGSTAYNLSVGGPILAPTLSNVVLAPIAPHTLTLRPVVIGGDSLIRARVESRAADFRLSIDGRSLTIPCGVPVTIRKAPYSLLTVRRPGENFASTLRGKLLWGH